MEVKMNTFDWYGNRVVQQRRASGHRSGYLQIPWVFAFALTRLGLGLVGENVSD